MDKGRPQSQHHRGGGGRGDHKGGRKGNEGHGNNKSSGNTFIPRAGEERPKKDSIIDLSKYQDKKVRIKFVGGREVVGILKGWDQLMNLVLDDTQETLRDPDDHSIMLEQTRELGTVVVRGPLLQTFSPFDGTEVIDNPFI